MSLQNLQKYFNASTALVFFDVKPANPTKDSKMTKVVAYLPDYKANLNDTAYNGSALPYREQFSSGPLDNCPTFKDHVSDHMRKYGTVPVSTATATEKTNPFQTEFPNGVRLQFAFLPQADDCKVGDVLGVAQVWATPGDTKLTSHTPNLTIPAYRAGHEIKIFRGTSNFNCTAHYVATLGTKPYYDTTKTSSG